MENKQKKRRLAIVTGGGSGIGFCLARQLAKRGFCVVLVGRDEHHLRQAAKAIDSYGERAETVGGRGKKAEAIGGHSGNAEIFPCDLSKQNECRRLYEAYRRRPVSVLINSAGLGVYGEFGDTDLAEETEMLAVNCRAVHMLMKLFLSDMERRGGGWILNVASSAGLMPGGPYMAAYYAAKAYVVSLTRGVAKELRARCSPVYAGALCPGPVDTPFFERAGIRAAVKGADPETVARAALEGMRRRQTLIVPGASNRLACAAAKLLPSGSVLAVNRRIQAKKRKTE